MAHFSPAGGSDQLRVELDLRDRLERVRNRAAVLGGGGDLLEVGVRDPVYQSAAGCEVSVGPALRATGVERKTLCESALQGLL